MIKNSHGIELTVCFFQEVADVRFIVKAMTPPSSADYAGSELNLRLTTSGSRGVEKPIAPWLVMTPDLTAIRDLHGRRGRDPGASARYDSG